MLDVETLVDSAKKTARVVVADESVVPDEDDVEAAIRSLLRL